jgi:hypothetical protein
MPFGNMVWFTVFGSGRKESVNAIRSIQADTIQSPGLKTENILPQRTEHGSAAVEKKFDKMIMDTRSEAGAMRQQRNGRIIAAHVQPHHFVLNYFV